MSYSKQLKKQQKKKAREKSAKKETTKVQNKSTKAPTNINPNTAISEKYLEKLQTSFNSSLAELEPEEFINKFSDQYRLNMINGLAKNHFTENIEAYYLESVLTNNIRIFNNFVYEGKFFNVDMIKNSVRSSGMASLNVLLGEVFGATQAFLLMPYVVKVNKEENRNDINEKYINKLNEQLSSYLEEKLTLDTLEQFMNNIASKIPNIYKFALANTPKNEQDLHKINERYSKANDLNEDLNITNQLSDNNRNKYKKMIKDFYDLMINECPKAVNNFREKYLTNNYDIKFDIYSNEVKEEDLLEFKEDLCDFIITNMRAEEESTNMKIFYYHEGNRNLLDEVGKEIGINIEELIQKCEHELKHEIRTYIVPYGRLENLINKFENADKVTWNQFQGARQGYINKLDHEALENKLKERDFFIELYTAFVKDLFSLKELENKISFEDILKNEISKKVEIINFNIENEYCRNIINNPNFEFDFNFDYNGLATEIVEKDNYTDFKKYFEKKDFEKLLKQKVVDKLKTYLESFKNTHNYYKNKIEQRENIVERVCEFMRFNLEKNHAKYNNTKKSNFGNCDYYDLEGFKADYEKVLELLNISKDSKEFEEIDHIISVNIKCVERYNKTTPEDKQENRMKNVRDILAKGSKYYS